MNIYDVNLKKAKIIDDIAIINEDNIITTIIPVYDGTNKFIGGIFEQNQNDKKVKFSFDEKFILFSQLSEMFTKHKIEKEGFTFVKDCLLLEGITENSPIVEIKTTLENSITRRLVRCGQAENVVLVSSLLSYSECEKLGFCKVISGETLTGNKQIWTCDHKLKDRNGVEHPDLQWAIETKENLSFDKSTLLCLSRRNDITKLVGQFKRAYIGYYGLANSDNVKWAKAFYEKEMEKSMNKFMPFEKSTILSDDSEFILRMFIKR